MSDRLLFVTQVAPYADGPAGVHGVLDQAAVGVAECAELAGVSTDRVDDVRALPERILEEADAIVRTLERAGKDGRWPELLGLARAVEGALALGRRW